MSTFAGPVQAAVANAENSVSNIPPEVIELTGLTGLSVKHLYNNLAAIPNITALFVQPDSGASVCSALAGNSVTIVTVNDLTVCTVDKEALISTIQPFKGSNTVTLIEENLADVDISGLPTFNLISYNGSCEAGRVHAALNYYLPVVADEFIVVINDWYGQTCDSVNGFISEHGLTVEYSKEEGEPHVGWDPLVGDVAGWWKRIYVAVLKKQTV